MEWDIGLALNGLIVHRAVTKDQEMFVLGMFKEIENTLFLEEAGNEIEIRLAVLNTVCFRLILALKSKSKTVTSDTPILKDLFDNIRDIFVLENPTVLLQGKEDRYEHKEHQENREPCQEV